jgi:hypothetical protein
MSVSKDSDVRRALRVVEFSPEKLWPGEIVLEEVCIHGRRADACVFGPKRMVGYEIKSAADTLKRLKAQAQAYSLFFDFCYIVSDERHLGESLEIVPGWWGAIAASGQGNTVGLSPVRAGAENPSRDPDNVLKLLWKDELQAIMVSLGIKGGGWRPVPDMRWRILKEIGRGPEGIGFARQKLAERAASGRWRDSEGHSVITGAREQAVASVAAAKAAEMNRQELLRVSEW